MGTTCLDISIEIRRKNGNLIKVYWRNLLTISITKFLPLLLYNMVVYDSFSTFSEDICVQNVPWDGCQLHVGVAELADYL